MTTLKDYTSISKMLQCNKEDVFPSTLHGYVCGVVCGSHANQKLSSLQLALNQLKEEFQIKDIHQSMLAQLMVTAFQQLNDVEFKFHLLLPEDDYTFQLRLKALTKWCQAFLGGLGDVGLTQESISSESSDVLQDILNISQMEYTQHKTHQDDEWFYSELVEHLKIGILLLFTTLQKIAM